MKILLFYLSLFFFLYKLKKNGVTGVTGVTNAVKPHSDAVFLVTPTVTPKQKWCYVFKMVLRFFRRIKAMKNLKILFLKG